MFRDRKNAVWIILVGCVHEGYSVEAVKTTAQSAEGAWNNLKGRETYSDHRIELWVDGKLVKEENR